ncbi:hypothetical protein CC86DRAFT_471605 [Ophiobolus disseminans]|uniref:6-phosphogluconate dehydrogenase C-terminal domain-like protein n=1 Tax=Ophiobolus disseminans TaxID=1469910 RepID=A0A6A6ZI74_9PLEO|nr:hypothetical protein CC86DRAFT_471605 [Ophiobolus disseminans]
MSNPQPTIAILSIGQMGLGIASLLIAHDYRVITNVSDRSSTTQDRAKSANIHCVNSDEDLVSQADYILSIVPPRDAITTAQRIQVALKSVDQDVSTKEIWYADLNAISPSTARIIAQSFATHAPHIKFIDGGIIGHPPSPPASTSAKWTKPSMPVSGPHTIPDMHLFEALNMRDVGKDVGSASGLKCCFAALSKGFTALSLQSYTTAAKLDVLPQLQEYLDIYNLNARAKAEKSIVGCTGKAYRWVEEMNQIGECFAQEGGWREQARVFREVAGVFEGLADVVEREGTEGMGDAEGVVRVLGEGLGGGTA